MRYTDVKIIDNTTLYCIKAEKSFQQFIHSRPEQSTMIGEIKPNASELEMLLMRNKIASTILSMQEMDKALESQSFEKEVMTDTDCFIEVTRVSLLYYLYLAFAEILSLRKILC